MTHTFTQEKTYAADTELKKISGRYSITLEEIWLQSYVVLFEKICKLNGSLFLAVPLGCVLSDDREEGRVTQRLIYQRGGFRLRVLAKPDLEFRRDKVVEFGAGQVGQ